MFRKISMAIVFCLSASVVGCSAAPGDGELDEGFETAESTEAALSYTYETDTARTAVPYSGPKTITSNVDPQRACTCADHPKPGYDCNGCYMWDLDGDGKSVCYCTYGLKDPSSAGGD